MANNLIQLKRTSVSGRVPNTVTLPNPGELALNMTDGILYSTNGAQVFEIGANNTNVNVSNTLTVKTVSANGSNGTSGQVLTSNGTVSYWADVSGAVSVNVNAQYIWTNTQTFTNLITFSDSITIGNSSVNTEIDAGYISVGNSSVNTQIEPGIVRLSGSEIFIGNDVVVNSSSIFVGNVDIAFDSINVGNVSVSTNNIQIEGRYVLTSETAGVANDALYLGGIAAANYQTIAGLSSNVATLTANNTNFVGSVSAANVVSNAQLSANLGNYQTTAGLAGNVATLAANSATYLNGNTASDLQTYADNKASNAYTNAVSYVDGKSYVNNSQLSSNLANYQTIAGLAGNVAQLTSNNASYAFGKTEDALNVNSAYNSNNSNFLGGVAAADYQTEAGLAANVAQLSSNNASYAFGKTESSLNVNSAINANNASYLNGNTASDLLTYIDNKSGNAYTNAVSYVDGKSYVNTSQLSGNLSNYAQLSGAAFTGNVSANNANTLYDLTVGRNLTVAGNLNVTGNVTVIGANNLSIVDNFIYLNSNNEVDNIDIGFAGNYNDGVYRHAGFFRDASDGYWKVFDGYQPEPDANVNIDTGNNTFRIANFWANNARVGNTTVYSTVNSTAFSGSANDTTYFGGNDISNFVRTSGAYTLSGNITFNSNVSLGAGLRANGSYGNAGQVLVSNGSGGIYWSEDQLYGNVVANAITVNILTVNFISLNTGTISVGNTTVNTDIGNNYISVGNSSSYSNIYSSYISIGNSVNNTVINSTALNVKTIYANGSVGTAGQILASNGTGLYWTNDQGVNAITANSLTANYVTVTRGTLTVGNSTVNTDIGNNYVSVGNTSGFVNVYSNRILIGGASINSTVYTGTANPNLDATFVWNNNHTFSDIVTFNDYIYVNSRLRANGSFGTAGEFLASNGTGVYWETPPSVNVNAQYAWTNDHTFGDIVTFNDYIYVNSRLRANGTFGGAGDVLFSNGTGVYWAAPSVNVNATYAWTNSHTFADTVAFNGNTTLNANITIGVGARLRANGTFGTAGQVLATNGTGVYWTNDQGANSITANSLTANFVSITSGTLTVGNSTVNTDIGNNYISVGNTTGFVNVYSDRIYIGNSVANATINSTFYTGTANSANYVKANNGIVSNADGVFVKNGFNISVNSGGVFVNTTTAYNWTSSHTFTNGIFIYYSGLYTANGVVFGPNSGISINGNFGTNGQVLATNGSAIYWTADQGANAITANSLTANFVAITSGTLTVGNSTVNTDIGNNYISVGNTSGFVNVYSDRIYIGNSAANATINSTVYTGTANNATYFGGNDITNFVRTSGAHTLSGNITFNGNIALGTSALLIANGSIGGAGQVLTSTGTNGSSPYWSTLPGVNTSAQYIWSNTQTFNGNIALGTSNRITANGGIGIAGQVLTTSGNDGSPYWSTPSVNVNAQYTWTNTHTFTNTITFSQTINGTANNTSFVGSVSAANVVSNAQLSGNLSNYQTTAGLAANVAKLAANSATYLGSSINSGNSTGIYSTGVMTANGIVSGLELTSTLASGDEGGQINLAKPPNAITAGGVTIDAYQNKIRIFEQGGNARGAYIDLTACADGVGTNLLTGGGGGGGTVTSVGSGNGLTGGPITGSGTLSVLANTGIVANSTGLFVNATYISTLTANNTSFVGSVSAANVVSNAQLSANLANYQTTAGLADNVATLTANSASYIGTISAANVVSNAQLSANLANYQTTAGLAANVATLAANNTSYLGGVAAANYVNTSGAYTLSGNLTFNGNVTIGTSAGINANGTYGTSGQVLTSNGTTVYWSTVTSGTGVNTDAQYTWTNTQTFSNTVFLNAVSANGSLGSFGQVLTSNGSDVYWSTVSGGGGANVTSAGISATSDTFTANGSADTFTLSESVANAPDIIVSINGLVQTPTTHYGVSGANITFTSIPENNDLIEVRIVGLNPDLNAQYTWTNTHTHNANVVYGTTAGISANGSFGTAGQVLTSNGTTVYWSTVTGGGGGSTNVDAQYTWTNTQTFSNTITFSQTINGTANNSLYLGGTIASGYQTTAGLAANVATLTANNTTNLGGVAAASYVQNTDSRTLSGNLVFSGANNTISGNLTVAATGELIVAPGAGIYANGGLGSAGQLLTTNGSSVYWSTVTGGGGGGINTLSFNGFYSGYNTSAIIGGLRRYFANNITVNKLTAWVGVTSGSNVTLTLKKNGTEIANVVVAAGNSIANTILSSNVIADNDYLTLDLSSGSGTDIGVRVDYTPY